MALDKATYKATIKAKLLELRNSVGDGEAQADELAEALANAADVFVKGVTITYTTGLTAGGDPVVGSFSYTIS